jgi:hypothetical protein
VMTTVVPNPGSRLRWQIPPVIAANPTLILTVLVFALNSSRGHFPPRQFSLCRQCQCQ